ncbi:MFS transporter [Corynebacterium liangguodongii]|uniref:MFS transporter n=1 Tax=Corynebacterium liangguodongii TaxID=2079535 RepID=A0A2S0WFF7_9CORY|nr:MFS transporter [Corynebacterium liangguodongii]AWB84402.1 MFS transporter [Corynebacterium liangguodongii]PWB99892.1 MFS transporter [Corynebacterium liangguodongii]
MERRDPREQITIKALTVWLAAVAVYVVAITGRTSFGVAGIDAIERFEVDASRVAVFTAVQIGVYALVQIPVGLLIDKFGPRLIMVVGALVMGLGQVLLGFTDSYPVAILARVLIGAGDATAFVSALRLLPSWFPMRSTPLFTQLTSAIGQLGQFISAVPFLALLHAEGWTVAFVSLGAVAALIAILALVAIADTPDPVEEAREDSRGPSIREILSIVLRSPLCWEAFAIHGLGMMFMITFTLLWGMPIMVQGMGLSPTQAGTVLTVYTFATALGGPFLAPISARAGKNRDLAAAAISAVHFITWAVFFASTQPRGMAAALIVAVIMGVCTPISNFGFDNVRERMPRSVVASGTGLGNMGGFAAGMIATQVIGLLLDATAPDGNYTWGNFRIAWAAVLGMWVLLLAGMFYARHLVGRGGASEGARPAR